MTRVVTMSAANTTPKPIHAKLSRMRRAPRSAMVAEPGAMRVQRFWINSSRGAGTSTAERTYSSNGIPDGLGIVVLHLGMQPLEEARELLAHRVLLFAEQRADITVGQPGREAQADEVELGLGQRTDDAVETLDFVGLDSLGQEVRVRSVRLGLLERSAAAGCAVIVAGLVTRNGEEPRRESPSMVITREHFAGGEEDLGGEVFGLVRVAQAGEQVLVDRRDPLQVERPEAGRVSLRRADETGLVLRREGLRRVDVWERVAHWAPW